jgi:ABC-2 type transport system permease protein
VLGSLITGRIILSGKDFGPVSDGLVLRAYVGSVLYCGLIAVLSLGIATIVRHTAASITVMLALPIIASVVTDPV